MNVLLVTNISISGYVKDNKANGENQQEDQKWEQEWHQVHNAEYDHGNHKAKTIKYSDVWQKLDEWESDDHKLELWNIVRVDELKIK